MFMYNASYSQHHHTHTSRTFWMSSVHSSPCQWIRSFLETILNIPHVETLVDVHHYSQSNKISKSRKWLIWRKKRKFSSVRSWTTRWTVTRWRARSTRHRRSWSSPTRSARDRSSSMWAARDTRWGLDRWSGRWWWRWCWWGRDLTNLKDKTEEKSSSWRW